MLAWAAFAAVWIGRELVEQREIRASVERVASGEAGVEELVPYDFEAALYLIQELNQDESWDEGVRLAYAIRKLLKGRVRPSARRQGSLVRVTFFQRKALTAALDFWPEDTAEKVRRSLEGEQPGDILLDAEEREALNDLARSWRAEPAKRASSTNLRALLEGAPLEEVKPNASEIELFWTVIGNWRLEGGGKSRAAEKRLPNPYLIIETSDATKRERENLLSALNLHKRRLATRLLRRFAADGELRALSRLLGDPDIGGEMEEVFRARGLLSSGEPVGQDEAERESGGNPG